MGKLTRSGFLAAAAGALVVLSSVLTGCGAGTRENSDFRGAYSPGSWRLSGAPARVQATETRSLQFTLDAKGEMLGTFTSDTGVIYKLTGEFDNDGSFEAEVRSNDGSETYSAEGFFSRQQVPFPDPEGGPDTLASGIAGNFTQTINGVEYTGTFFAPGGTTDIEE